jgi:hypothetical protein
MRSPRPSRTTCERLGECRPADAVELTMRRLALLVLLLACSRGPRPTLSAALDDARCEEAALYVRAHQPALPDNLARQLLEKVVSHVAGGLGQTTDILGLIAGGIVNAVTEGRRCTDLTPLSRDLRAIAACYTERDEPGDRAIGETQLRVLRDSAAIYACVSPEERQAIDREIAAASGPGAELSR